ncbi:MULTISPECIES: SDR family NAD(P)-dependent oxidoreductase [unclassified Novosphingobium]|nr:MULTISPECIES: SDR family oxidoreductase [unclassified Novosphingobium]PTR12559.1 NAD(P)-dependent dehydrogenase (short-subunit alcohol dehydrogenase family) [Novosphingobium sp. GV055]PUB06343.1 NAD(P)-dependent dehydrogenase (short-subunit alcohol dehydrogenase family) [Novosphingobium sp. GV061]PUB22394.1 NAD(P)-dependent dehydrogenase (short-subunit alcohol dehydrogenase family) [Novosphingobium sp. GV079]PUB44419.1 NAD(P)-dependent dehydrogenase (short-subunit alcohol dehydrogenase famil
MTLAGKCLFVTGGNSGIGFATALRFAREGADIAILSRRAGANEVVKTEIEALGVRCLTIAGSVTDEDAVREAVEATVKTFGGIDYAFNCAGLSQSVTPIESLALEEFIGLMDINARGTFLSMKYQIPVMRARGGGAICNCASAAGLIPSAFQVAYAGAKFAVVGLTRGTALEVAKDNIRVNVVCPGATTGEMWIEFAERHPDRAALALAKHPLGRVGYKEEVADAVLFLNRDATFTTGHALPVDGGRTAG